MLTDFILVYTPLCYFILAHSLTTLIDISVLKPIAAPEIYAKTTVKSSMKNTMYFPTDMKTWNLPLLADFFSRLSDLEKKIGKIL